MSQKSVFSHTFALFRNLEMGYSQFFYAHRNKTQEKHTTDIVEIMGPKKEIHSVDEPKKSFPRHSNDKIKNMILAFNPLKNTKKPIPDKRLMFAMDIHAEKEYEYVIDENPYNEYEWDKKKDKLRNLPECYDGNHTTVYFVSSSHYNTIKESCHNPSQLFKSYK